MRHAGRWALMALVPLLWAPSGPVWAEDHASTGSTAEKDAPRGAYSGGFFDDGFVEDDWFYDYYDIQMSEANHGRPAGGKDRHKNYEAEQLYEGARTSGLFEF